MRHAIRALLHTPARTARGFSLLEMMVVVGILGVMAAIAVPDLAPAVHDAKLRGVGDEVVNFIERARREAKAQGRCFLISKNAQGALEMRRRSTVDCVTTLNATVGWDAPLVTLQPPQNFTIDLVPVPSGASTPLVVRPNGRVRGNGNREVNDDGALLRVRYAVSPVRWDITLTSIGRICGHRTRGPIVAPSTPVACVGGSYGNGGNVAGGVYFNAPNSYPVSPGAACGGPSCGSGTPACGGSCGEGGAPLAPAPTPTPPPSSGGGCSGF